MIFINAFLAVVCLRMSIRRPGFGFAVWFGLLAGGLNLATVLHGMFP